MTNKEVNAILDYVLKKADCSFSKFVAGHMYVIANYSHLPVKEEMCIVGLVDMKCSVFHPLSCGCCGDKDTKTQRAVNEMFSISASGKAVVAVPLNSCACPVQILKPGIVYEQIVIDMSLDVT